MPANIFIYLYWVFIYSNCRYVFENLTLNTQVFRIVVEVKITRILMGSPTVRDLYEISKI